MRQEGQLTQWDDAKGYGFITPKGGGPKLFVHIKAFGLRPQRPRQGELLSYEAGADAQGKPRALKVRGESLPPAGTRKKPAPPKQGVSSHTHNSQLWLIPLFAAFVLLCQLRWPLPPAVWGTYMAMSLATFIVYAGDKRAARLKQWRVSENTLHGLALICGWPGALLARHILRHKSSKPGFTRIFWLTVVLNWAGYTLVATPLLQSLR